MNKNPAPKKTAIKKIETVIQDFSLDSLSFGGDPDLKPAGAQIPIPPECVLEYAKCAEDPVYFAEHYVKILTLDDGVINIPLRPFQKNIINTVKNERYTIVKCGRQGGKTTVMAILLVWFVLFTEQYHVGVMANKVDQSIEIMDRIKGIYRHLPKWMQQGIIKWNEKTILLENGSKIEAFATSSSGARGKSLNFILMDEFAHIDGNLQQKFFTSTFPIISAGKTTKLAIISTPNGFEWFAKIWLDAIKEEDEPGKNQFVPIEVNWWDIPGRDEKWKEETIRNSSAEQFRQEYSCEFIGSSDTLLSPECLSLLTYKNPTRTSQNVKIFEEPVKGHLYIIVVDVARGGGGDFSVFVVVDVTTFPYQVVATFRDNTIAPSIYPNYINHASKIYNDAYILVETNDIGGQVADILNDEFENEQLLTTGSTAKNGQVLGMGTRFGVRTTTPVKRIGCFALKGLMENQQIICNDAAIVDEFFTFIAKGTSYAAQESKHDDLVMCLVLFAWASTQRYFIDLLNSDTRQKLLERNEQMIEDNLVPFGVFDDGRGAFTDDEGLVTWVGMFGNDW